MNIVHKQLLAGQQKNILDVAEESDEIKVQVLKIQGKLKHMRENVIVIDNFAELIDDENRKDFEALYLKHCKHTEDSEKLIEQIRNRNGWTEKK